MYHFELGCLSLFTPLVGFIYSYWFAFHERKKGEMFCVFTVALSFFASFSLLLITLQLQDTIYIHFFTWIKSEFIRVNWGMMLDPLSASMMTLVGFVSLLVHIYSLAYMQEDANKTLFFAYLNLFTFMMLILVCAPNMLQMFCGWEGVGLASYLLIGFWREKETATKAAIKAFVVNRVSDIGFILAMGAIFYCFHTLDFSVLLTRISSGINLPSQFYIDVICVLLFVGAMGKSAQFSLHTWLPDAMEAPTPVSALLHAATMVTAGVFLIIRFSPIIELSPLAKNVIMIIGMLTGIFAGSVALAQNDIKKIIAYSTCSQLGMMFMACAAGAYSAAFFHLFTHAFFKALLFLGAGTVIHAMSHEQNIKRMGGLKRYLPFSYYNMVIGTLALTGVPFFAGYYSKDLIFEAIYQASPTFYICGLFLALLTSLYSWRLILLVFHGDNQSDDQVIGHIHHSPSNMRVPIIILTVCSVIMGFLGYRLFIKESFGFSWSKIIVDNVPPETPWFVIITPLVLTVIGFFICFWLYIINPKASSGLSRKYKYIYRWLVYKWFFDEIYDRYVIAPAKKLGGIFYSIGDKALIDKFGPDGIAKVALRIGAFIKKPQTGYVNNYVMIAILGVSLILGAYVLLQSMPNLTKDLRVFMGRV
jgi:NADH-quinone oxidoreductase subunit L